MNFVKNLAEATPLYCIKLEKKRYDWFSSQNVSPIKTCSNFPPFLRPHGCADSPAVKSLRLPIGYQSRGQKPLEFSQLKMTKWL